MIEWREHGQGVGVVSLSRPPVNALDTPAKEALRALFDELAERRDIGCLVIRSDLPNTFCAGSDLKELAGEHAEPGVAWRRTKFEFDMWQQLSSLPQVAIAAIDGHALGSGLELAVACDLRVAGESANLGLPEIKIGGAPGIQVIARLPMLVGLATATRMLLEGDPLTATQAMAAGLVHELTPAGRAEERALDLAVQLAGRPRSSLHFLKGSLAAALDGAIQPVATFMEHNVEGLFRAHEMREGISAFIEKRPPVFHPLRASLDEAGGR